MQQFQPHIPTDAPFSPEQREWLNGLLANLFTSTFENASVTPATAPLRIGVYFATQSGTAERLAKKAVKELKAKGHAAELHPLERTPPTKIAEQENALFLVSTYGEGDPPDSAKGFRDTLFSDTAPSLGGLRYSVFCLGDRHYEQFCKFGIELDERLQALGATPLFPRVESDVDVDEPFAHWTRELLARLTQSSSNAAPSGATVTADPIAPIAAPEPAQTHTRDNPFHAVLLERRPLTHQPSSKLTLHLSLGLDDSAIEYRAGDACGVIVQNDPALIEEILSLLPFDGGLSVEIPRVGRFPIADALLRHLQPTRLTRKTVQAFAEKTRRRKLHGLLGPDQSEQLDAYMYGRGLIDMLHEYPGTIASPDELVAMLPRLAPRLYSISSSPATHGREVHCTVAVVRYRTHKRERGGVGSTMLECRVGIGSRLPIYIQPNKKFRLPADGNTPMIMIGPGTGIAPFRAFLHERRTLGHKGPNWLFFGERSAATDFLYSDELQNMSASGHLTRFDTAFSRDQAHKIYVQDRMREQGAEMWRWLNDGAQIYVCGDASRMAKDVDAALHSVVEMHGGLDQEAAREYVSQLHDDRRYHRDVY